MRRICNVLGLQARQDERDATARVGRCHGGAVHELAALERVVRNRRDGTTRGADGNTVVAIRATRGAGRQKGNSERNADHKIRFFEN